jgi:hypothetical protein
MVDIQTSEVNAKFSPDNLGPLLFEADGSSKDNNF